MSNKFEGPFRQSTINDFMVCQRKGYYKHILKLEGEFRSPYLIFGTAMHEAIANLHRSQNFVLIDLIVAAEGKEPSPVYWKNRDEEIADWLPDAEAILANYWAKDYNREAKVIYAEADFEVNIGPFPFIGTIDQLRFQGSEVHLVDFKSGTAGIPQTFIDLDYQLTIYAMACAYGRFKVNNEWMTFGTLPDRMAIYKLNDHLPYKRNGKNQKGIKGEERGPARYFTTRTEADIEAAKRDLGFLCRQIVGPHYGTRGLVRGGSFARNPINVGGLQTCGQCQFQQECLADRFSQDVKMGKMENLLTDEDFAHENA